MEPLVSFTCINIKEEVLVLSCTAPTGVVIDLLARLSNSKEVDVFCDGVQNSFQSCEDHISMLFFNTEITSWLSQVSFLSF